ncbi:MAG: S-adenosylmethionine:tRNA ribosyltransferase-isomerase [Bacteroidales bacterium]|nr:S-adenosylmethionine:tRNA ribosyltransferase-isomerase [Bacteroidales bacterium]
MLNKYISISEYTYDLPEDRIAKFPLDNRDQSKLLCFSGGEVTEDRFSSLPRHIPGNSILFFNNTKVIHARLRFKKQTGANIEIFCLQPLDPADYQLAFSEKGSCTWLCMVGNLKKWKNEILSMEVSIHGESIRLSAKKVSSDERGVSISFSWDNSISFAEIIHEAGIIPIPPYLNRDPEAIDQYRYQTVYSRHDGSVAAPTAGLHFTPEILEAIAGRGIQSSEITLHVGAGTFQPVKHQNVFDHRMHSEHVTVPRKVIHTLSQTDRKLIATGTTTLRTLESLYWLAVKSLIDNTPAGKLEQWEYEELPDKYSPHEVFAALNELLINDRKEHFQAETRIMITPGYNFRLVEGLITNFHQPGSTLLLLIAAFIGENWKKVYQYALSRDFRFLSYGDSSILWRTDH